MICAKPKIIIFAFKKTLIMVKISDLCYFTFILCNQMGKRGYGAAELSLVTSQRI